MSKLCARITLRESDAAIAHGWLCDRPEMQSLSILVASPAIVLFTQGYISSTFSGGSHKRKPLDTLIEEQEAQPNYIDQILPLDLSFQDGLGLIYARERGVYVSRITSMYGLPAESHPCLTYVITGHSGDRD